MALNSWDFHALALTAISGLLNSLLAGAALTALAWVIARTAARKSSQTRFLVWIITFIAMLFLPWVGPVAVSSYATGSTRAAAALTLPGSVAYYLVLGWAFGAIVGVLHVAHGLYRLQRLRATCTPVSADQLDRVLWASLKEIQSKRAVTLCVSDAVRVPAAIGYFRPMVVFPTWALTEIPTKELSAILLHELAHLRRYDDWTNLAQKLVKAVLFFHPAVWFIESRLTLEREMACDDAVLASSYSPRAYAESLVSLAEKSFLRRGIHLAQAAVSQVQQLKLRLAEILRRDRSASRQGSERALNSAVVCVSLAAMISVFGIVRAPQLVGFSSELPRVASTAANSHAVATLGQSRLQPVNLTFVERPKQSAVITRRVQPDRQRMEHRGAKKTPMMLAHYVGGVESTEEVFPPAIRTAASFPMELTASPVLVVFQGEQFGFNGPVFWRVTVIHLTPAQQRAISGEIPKQI